MLVMHYQRFSMLLCGVCSVYVILYMLLPLFHGVNYVYDCLLTSSTLLVSCLIFDSISLSFSAVVMYISMCVFFFSRYYMLTDPFYNRFMWLLVTFVASMNVLILSGSLLTMLVGWDGLGVSSFALIMYYQSKESLTASFMTLLVNRLGDIIIMSSMGVFIIMGSSLLTTYTMSTVYIMMLLFSFAALTKSAQYPFCAWLPAAMAAPTPVSALVHSSTLVTAGVYILIRACYMNSIPLDVSNLLLFCGAITSFIGGCCALFENDIKKLIALSTLSQLGVMMFSLGLGLYNFALLHLFTHAMFKALLFLAAGCVLLMSFGVQDLRLLGGVSKSNPLLLVFLNVSAFCLMGLPFLSAFYSKHAILSAMWCQSMNIVAVFLMLASTLLSSIYMLRFLKALNWGPNHSCAVATPYYLGFYTPLCFLFLGSCLSGWFFINIDMSYVMSTFSYSVYDKFLYMIALSGVFIGLMTTKTQGNELCSSMFYMVPVWRNINFISHKFVKTLKNLDSGWLEPNTYSSSISQISSYMFNIVSTWPPRNFNFIPWSVLMTLFFLLLTCLY
uniref:NADH-ubiquinone oxidoreductase chain 5 n=1 Tax=Helix pomatia TaxID=6536 RepID=A0A481YK96_HELPO|nr:NADH dehydrogenase subunit 5 [Helix pomatia]